MQIKNVFYTDNIFKEAAIGIDEAKFITNSARIDLGPCISTVFSVPSFPGKPALMGINHIYTKSLANNLLLDILQGYKQYGYTSKDIKCVLLLGGMSTQSFTSIDVTKDFAEIQKLLQDIPGVVYSSEYSKLHFNPRFTTETLTRISLIKELQPYSHLFVKGYNEINTAYEWGLENLKIIKQLLGSYNIKPLYDLSGQAIAAQIILNNKQLLLNQYEGRSKDTGQPIYIQKTFKITS